MEFFHANSKNYLRYLHFLFLHFLYNVFFSTNEDFEHLSMKKDPFNQIIRKWQPKSVFVDLLEKCLGMNDVYEVMCTCGFKFLRTFVRIFEMYELSTAIFIKVFSYKIFHVKCLW